MQHGCNKHGPGKSQNKDTESSVGLAISCEFALKGTSDSGQFEILTTCLKFCNFPLCRKALMWKIEEGGILHTPLHSPLRNNYIIIIIIVHIGAVRASFTVVNSQHQAWMCQ